MSYYCMVLLCLEEAIEIRYYVNSHYIALCVLLTCASTSPPSNHQLTGKHPILSNAFNITYQGSHRKMSWIDYAWSGSIRLRLDDRDFVRGFVYVTAFQCLVSTYIHESCQIVDDH